MGGGGIYPVIIYRNISVYAHGFFIFQGVKMAYTFPQLKQIRDNIIMSFGISSDNATRVVAFYNVGANQDHDIIDKMLSGDLSSVPAALSALGISSDIVQATPTNESREEKNAFDLAKKTAKRSPKNFKNATRTTADITGNKQPSESVRASSLGASDTLADKIPVDDIKDHIKDNNAFQDIKQHDDIIPAADAEIMQDTLDELPEGFADTVRQWLEDWATFEKIDLTRLHAQQWRALCMYIGQKVKHSKVIVDTSIKRAGRTYSGKKLEALLSLWAYFCGMYKQVPLVSDFVSFSGVSSSYFYDYEGRGLSSSSVSILKKARRIEETGLGSSVAGGGAGTVGGIFLLKARHGYSETVTVNHVSAAPSVGLAELPKLTTSGDLG